MSRNLPYPLSNDCTIPFLHFVGSVILGEGRDLIASVNRQTDEELRTLPSYQAMAYIAGLLVNRRIISFLPPLEHGKTTDHRPEIVDLEAADGRLAKFGPFQAAVLEGGRTVMTEVMGHQATVYDSIPEFSFLDLDFSMFDFPTLGVMAGQT